MIVSLWQIVLDLHNNGKTGMLSSLVKEENALLKMYFRSGTIYHMACRKNRNLQCLTLLKDMNLANCSFTENLTVKRDPGDLPDTPEVIEQLRLSAKQVDSSYVVGDLSAVPQSSCAKNDNQELFDALQKALINQIGPVGKMLFEKIVREQLQSASSTLSDAELLSLIDLLSAEIDDEGTKAEFKVEVEAIMAQQASSVSSASPTKAEHTPVVIAEQTQHKLGELQHLFTSQLGPVGPQLFSEIVNQNWKPQDPPSKEDWEKLIMKMKNEIEDVAEKTEFGSAVHSILST